MRSANGFSLFFFTKRNTNRLLPKKLKGGTRMFRVLNGVWLHSEINNRRPLLSPTRPGKWHVVDFFFSNFPDFPVEFSVFFLAAWLGGASFFPVPTVFPPFLHVAAPTPLERKRSPSIHPICNRVLLDFTGFYWVLPGFTGFHRVLLGFTGFLMGFNWKSKRLS